MAIYLTDKTRLAVQGATGRTGAILIEQIQEFGTNVVAGIAPGRSGETIAGVPVFETMREAVAEAEIDMSLILVPAEYMKDAALEALDAGVNNLVIAAEGAPIHDSLTVLEYAKRKGARVIGPNTLGLISPGHGAAILDHVKNNWYKPGPVGVVSRSGSLSVEIADRFTAQGLGQSTVMSVGGDPYLGTTPAEAIRDFDADPQTKVIAYVGEIGGPFEAQLAETLPDIDTPVVATVVGRHAPAGKKMGHAGAITRSNSDKLAMLESARASVVSTPFDLPSATEDLL